MTNEQIVARIKAGENIGENMALLYDQVKAFIHVVALRFQGRAELEDLEQEGYLALYPAIDGYDPSRGVKFLTYAEWHIRQRMQRYIQMNGSCLHLPVHCAERIQQYKKFCNAYMLEQGCEPSDREAASHLGLSLEQVEDIRKNACLSRVGSLDSVLPDDDMTTICDLLPDDTDLEGDALERMHYKQLKDTIWPMVDKLPEKQCKVIRMRFCENLTLKEAGQHIGVTIEAARQWEKKAFRELRRSSNLRKLRPFLPEVMEGRAYQGNGIGTFNRTWTSSTERVALELMISRNPE